MMLRKPRNQSGFTIIEVVVVVGLIALLVALLIPAVHAAREAARRMSCASNMRQIGLASQSYNATFNVFPTKVSGAGHSPFVALLPFMEQMNLYSSINMSRPQVTNQGGLNDTAENTRLSILLCPSDPANKSPSAFTNYAANVGYGFETSRSTEGIFSSAATTVASIKDGTSHTALMAEWLLGGRPGSPSSGAGAIDGQFYIFSTPPFSGDDGFEPFVEHCIAMSAAGALSMPYPKGQPWMRSGGGCTLYNHDIGLNGPSCSNHGSIPNGAWTAGSHHSRLVQVVFADGHVQPVRESIDLKTWRALGTRAGGELTDPIDY
jgi:prepilin-type N-terminal cleavage/methylation domain-containing protein/prepilin-type processing-associated H-X9-DG protein